MLYENWNNKINVISRKDISELNTRHVLHSLSIAKVINFLPETKILDVGTGGGFPGIPLAIMFPEVSFHLTDSIGKKIKVVQAIANALGLKNVIAEKIRSENVNQQYDFIISRAVTNMSNFVKIVDGKFSFEKQFIFEVIIGPDNAVQGEIYFGSPVDKSPLGAAPGAAGHIKISFLLK